MYLLIEFDRQRNECSRREVFPDKDHPSWPEHTLATIEAPHPEGYAASLFRASNGMLTAIETRYR